MHLAPAAVVGKTLALPPVGSRAIQGGEEARKNANDRTDDRATDSQMNRWLQFIHARCLLWTVARFKSCIPQVSSVLLGSL